MKVRIPKEYNAPNKNDMLRQFNMIQQEMEEKQQELEQQEYEITSGGGAVKVLISGTKEIKNIELSPDVVDKDDIEMLTDLLCSAINEGISKVEKINDEEIAKISGKMPSIPGLNI